MLEHVYGPEVTARPLGAGEGPVALRCAVLRMLRMLLQHLLVPAADPVLVLG